MGWSDEVVSVLVIQGAGGGEFIYNAAGQLIYANVGAGTTDPVHHINCPIGESFFLGATEGNALQIGAGGINGGENATLTLNSSGTLPLVLFQYGGAGPVAPPVQLIAAAAGDRVLGIEVALDPNFRFRIDSNGQIVWGPGSAGIDCTLGRQSAGILQLLTADLAIATAGNGLRIKAGANCRMGTATLVAGTVTVANTTVDASTAIFLSRTVPGGTLGHLSRTVSAGVSFTINSSSNLETSQINWLLIEPA